MQKIEQSYFEFISETDFELPEEFKLPFRVYRITELDAGTNSFIPIPVDGVLVVLDRYGNILAQHAVQIESFQRNDKVFQPTPPLSIGPYQYGHSHLKFVTPRQFICKVRVWHRESSSQGSFGNLSI